MNLNIVHDPLQMSPYKTKFAEKKKRPSDFSKCFTLKYGSPILIPNAFASLLLAIAQPSLLLKTTTGFLRQSYRKILSHELSIAFDNSAYQKLNIIESNKKNMEIRLLK